MFQKGFHKANKWNCIEGDQMCPSSFKEFENLLYLKQPPTHNHRADRQQCFDRHFAPNLNS